MLFRPFFFEETACASYLFGCVTYGKFAVLDPHVDLVDDYIEAAERVGTPIVAVLETHIQADHVSGLPLLVEKTGATAYLPPNSNAEFEHVALEDGEILELGNTVVRTLSTPGHAWAHNAYVVADRRRGTEEPWLVFTGDSLLVGDVGRPDLHAAGDPRPLALRSWESMQHLLKLPDDVVIYPSHYGGSVCGRGLSSNPFSTIGFERRYNEALQHSGAESFADALLEDLPPVPEDQAAIVSANRSGSSTLAS